MDHSCWHYNCDAYCSGQPCRTDIYKPGQWNIVVYVQKRSTGPWVSDKQFDDDLFSPLHFKATKALRQAAFAGGGVLSWAWAQGPNDLSRFSDRKQIDHFDEHRHNLVKLLEERKDSEKKRRPNFDRYLRDLSNYELRIRNWQHSGALTFTYNIRDLLEMRTHAGDRCQHYFHPGTLCVAEHVQLPYILWKHLRDHMCLTGHCLRMRARNATPREIICANGRVLFDKHIRKEDEKQGRRKRKFSGRNCFPVRSPSPEPEITSPNCNPVECQASKAAPLDCIGGTTDVESMKICSDSDNSEPDKKCVPVSSDDIKSESTSAASNDAKIEQLKCIDVSSACTEEYHSAANKTDTSGCQTEPDEIEVIDGDDKIEVKFDASTPEEPHCKKLRLEPVCIDILGNDGTNEGSSSEHQREVCTESVASNTFSDSSASGSGVLSGLKILISPDSDPLAQPVGSLWSPSKDSEGKRRSISIGDFDANMYEYYGEKKRESAVAKKKKATWDQTNIFERFAFAPTPPDSCYSCPDIPNYTSMADWCAAYWCKLQRSTTYP